MNKTLKNRIITYFEKGKTLSREELIKVILIDFPELKESSINVYLSNFKKEGVISNPSRGIYSLENKNIFVPNIDQSLKHLFNKIKKEFPFVIFTVWNTIWLNDFMRHQPFKHYQIVEIEKDAAEQVFNKLSESIKNVFFNPNAEIFERYIHNLDEIIIVKPLLSEAPLDKVENITTPTLEKLLVDMLIDVDVFSAQQGEIEYMYSTAFSKFLINKKRMKRYAIRRNREKQAEEIINIITA